MITTIKTLLQKTSYMQKDVWPWTVLKSIDDKNLHEKTWSWGLIRYVRFEFGRKRGLPRLEKWSFESVELFSVCNICTKRLNQIVLSISLTSGPQIKRRRPVSWSSEWEFYSKIFFWSKFFWRNWNEELNHLEIWIE